MKTFAVVVIYNGMKNNWIHQCFTSLLSSSTSVEIIAVDNHSSDESVQYIKKFFPTVILLERSENLGFGGANNLGLQKALELGGDFFFLLNQDAYVETNTLEKLINTSLQHSEYAVISPIHLNGKGTKLDKSFAKSVSPYHCDDFYDDYVLSNTKKPIYESPFICAAAWLLTKKTLEIVGGFSPAFFHYGEDDNYCHRVQYFKLKIGVVPDTYIYHDREDRPASIFDEKIVSLQRQYTLWCSNPNKPTDIDRLIGQFKNKMIKYTLLGNRKEAKDSRDILKFLQNKKHSIKTAYKDSISDKTYKFIG
ncbi:glycosyltransferase family 2 protein [Chryseobacterium sp. Ch-15]|uniref:Glycosyltransferase family 2 protein n=1 Tax=Chryseobacterium muglaense TaxID=2893752 RepID=A0A9Q3YVP4_9FLAO|nr:glycosyltransferase family 2 protein [Chryseobacterium muglaense]MBD3903826.1 glycosyltransferase family 2 protein [Chryseobacterium muglaense]MCC9034900.1 glycosyltransferase family 2 protein [Chryseobacterium muglaense]MCM2553165.1 glycosyltransferase family 2 protein [Chryseobacterium muglaense]